MDKWNLFDVEITDREKQELSDHLYKFHDEYENGFCDYFSQEKTEEVEDFMHWHKGLYDLVDSLMYRKTKPEKMTDSVT